MAFASFKHAKIKGVLTLLPDNCIHIDDEMHVYITDATKYTAVRSFLVEKTKLNPTAFFVYHINSIPKNSSGKTLYQELEKLHAQKI